MTVYTAITSGQIDAESPLDVTLAGQWTNNPIAITEGASGAPAIANAALAGYPFDAAGGDISKAGWVLTQAPWTATTVASKDFTWDESTYSDIMVVIDTIAPATDDVELWMQFGYNNGGTVAGGTSDYTSHYADVVSDPGTFAAYSGSTQMLIGGIAVLGSGVGSAAGETLSSTIHLRNLSASGQYAQFEADTSYESAGGVRQAYHYKGAAIDATLATSAIDTIRFLWESGNFDGAVGGTISVYGLKKA